MSEFYFKCPHCNANICADDDMIGEKAPCPGCGKVVVIAKHSPSLITKAIQSSTPKEEELSPEPNNKTNAAAKRAEESRQAPQKENADKSSHRINFFMIGLLILLNIQFGIFLYCSPDNRNVILEGPSKDEGESTLNVKDLQKNLELIQKDTAEYNSTVKQMQTSITEIKNDLSAHTQKTDKIVDCRVQHYSREQLSFGLQEAILMQVKAGYEPVGKICNDGINGAFYLFIKREKQ